MKIKKPLSLSSACLALLTVVGTHSIAQNFYAPTGMPGSGEYVAFPDAISADCMTAFITKFRDDGSLSEWRWTPESGMVEIGAFGGPDLGLFSETVDYLNLQRKTSDDGTVLIGGGFLDGVPQAFRWTAALGSVGLGVLPGKDVSEFFSASRDGHVVIGTSDSSGSANFFARAPRPWRWTPETGLVDLGLLPGRMLEEVTGISEDGSVIVGGSEGEAWKWTSSGGLTGLGFPPSGSYNYSLALAVSSDGNVIVGIATGANGTVAWRWTAELGMIVLGTLPGQTPDETIYASDEFRWTYPPDGNVVGMLLSSDGNVVVGQKLNPQGKLRVWRWQPDTGIVDLEVPPGAGGDVFVRFLSSDGSTLAGISYTSTGGMVPAWRWTKESGLTDFGGRPGETATDVYFGSLDGSEFVGFGDNPVGGGFWRWTESAGLKWIADDFASLAPEGLSPNNIKLSEDGSVLWVKSGDDSQNLLAVYKPIIRSLSPASRGSGDSAFTLVLAGIGFGEGSTVYWGGSPRPTTFINANRLEASISSADLATTTDIASAFVTVIGPSGATSTPKPFTILRNQSIVAEVESSIAAPTQSVTVSTAPNLAGGSGVSAILNNAGVGPVAVTVANYSSNPSGTAFSAGGGFTDVQITGADPADTASVNFYYPSTIDPGTEVALTLVYFDGSSWISVRGSNNSDPIKNTTDNLDGTISGGRFTVVLSSTSSPRITDLTGTFFATGIPDTIPPTLSCPNITVPCGLGTVARVDYPAATVSDNLDPAPRIVYSIPSGSGFSIGTTVVTCTATDASGNARSVTFTVTRAPLGFSGFLPPIGGADATGGSGTSPIKTFKAGSTIPVKFEAFRGDGTLNSGIHLLDVIKYANSAKNDPPIHAIATDVPNGGNQFRFAEQQWQFNLDTKATGMTVGIWRLRATLSDGSEHTVWIQIK